jgi:hypothetical protein
MRLIIYLSRHTRDKHKENSQPFLSSRSYGATGAMISHPVVVLISWGAKNAFF